MAEGYRVKCVHCGEFTPKPKDLEWLRQRTLVAGFQCPQCDDECYVLLDGQRVTPGQMRPARLSATSIVFVYGTLRHGQPNDRLWRGQRGCRFIDRGTTTGQIVDLGAFPAFLEGAGIVHGDLIAVSKPVLKRLDLLEGVGRGFYDRVEVTVKTADDWNIRAWIYRYADPASLVRPMPVPGGDWLAHVEEKERRWRDADR